AFEQHLIDVARRWMDPNGDGNPSDGVDGWRLLEAENLSAGFLSRFTAAVKAVNPNAYVVGEWRSSPAYVLGQGALDATTNYQLAANAHNYLMNAGARESLNPKALDTRLALQRLTLPER